ncbi:ARL14 effector protein [Drosophila hydei]|uniref:ARL14 effector protein n=1 Tax=Drosophila hydei TaxID=7224 RepID=A0A6J1M2G5_DROHY|nr:ARL14 effector protein [Drosophila hydei]
MSARSLRQRPQRKETIDDNNSTEAERSKRKVKKKACYYGKNSVYDEYGNIRSNGLDVCDCMNEQCDGCWYECRNCGSTRCGPQCRANRKFFYENIVYDGKDLTITNKHFSGKI